MDKLNKVLEILQREQERVIIAPQIVTENGRKKITWTNESEDECYIYPNDISIAGDKIAWFQSSIRDNHLVRIYEDNFSLSWEPETYNPVFGCYCLLMEWYKDHLIFIYQEKHCIYICSIKDKEINHFHFHGEDIERRDNLISYATYMDNPVDKVRLIQIPELIHVEPISTLEAEKCGLIPQGLNRPGNFLALKP
ncbi:hypothetical protein A4H97_23630 [Niastella yeongjuensis]|uniref:Uncharacterized protein n=1 Tax=Niastella yeongjuensis TaxID=354355 RepID=A0A1V9F4X6_9BACT|nr:hypothetical protein [Niastella yeongjuensis]OQP53439.1 hypothetical protein A4H97_23630 [Niastella yeongjuensis]SEP12208.1 hypothetical protein SAMN05660816_04475 [Niastella yeongjuensis]